MHKVELRRAALHPMVAGTVLLALNVGYAGQLAKEPASLKGCVDEYGVLNTTPSKDGFFLDPRKGLPAGFERREIDEALLIRDLRPYANDLSSIIRRVGDLPPIEPRPPAAGLCRYLHGMTGVFAEDEDRRTYKSVSVSVEIWPSMRNAELAYGNKLMSISVVLPRGTFSGVQVGELANRAPGPDSVAIHFLRRNAVVRVGVLYSAMNLARTKGSRVRRPHNAFAEVERLALLVDDLLSR